MVGQGVTTSVAVYQANPENGYLIPILMGLGSACLQAVGFLDKAVSETTTTEPVDPQPQDEGA